MTRTEANSIISKCEDTTKVVEALSYLMVLEEEEKEEEEKCSE